MCSKDKLRLFRGNLTWRPFLVPSYAWQREWAYTNKKKKMLTVFHATSDSLVMGTVVQFSERRRELVEGREGVKLRKAKAAKAAKAFC